MILPLPFASFYAEYSSSPSNMHMEGVCKLLDSIDTFCDIPHRYGERIPLHVHATSPTRNY